MSLNAVVERVRHAVCALHGHDALLQFERGRMYLKCVSCGYESPGWTVRERETRPAAPRQAPAVIHEVPRRRRFLPQVTSARRVA
jgi:hypothetical protein